MAKGSDWSREQLLVAFMLYGEMLFGKFHSRNPEIIRWATRIGRTPSALAMKLSNIASLDPKFVASGRKGLKGVSAADRAMWQEMSSDWGSFSLQIGKAVESFGATESPDNDLIDLGPAMPQLPDSFVGLTRKVVTEARIKQHHFRKWVLSAYSNRCCISGMSVPRLLIASHIVPWKDDPQIRLNPCNGLCLSALHDRAFDAGLIYLDDDLRVVLSRKLARMKLDDFTRETISDYAGKPIEAPGKFAPDLRFIRIHREEAIRRSKS